MAGPFDFTGQKIQDTYGRVVQLVTGSLYDGTGKLINSTIQDIADASNQRQSESIELSAISSSVVELQHFSSSLDADFATDAELSALSSSILVTTNNLADGIDENEEELDNQGTRIATLTAATSSYVIFPYTGSAVISGSLEIDGGTFISGGLNAHGTLSSFQYPLTITPEGTLGLGTNSPRNDSAVTVGGRMTFTTSNLIQMRSIPSTGGNIIRFGSSAASQGFIKGQEGFGIGTSNGFGGPGAWEVWGKGGGGEIVKTSWSSSYAAYHGTHAYDTGISRPFHLITSGNLNQIVLHTGSFVGIGLEDPQTNLHVSGAVSASTYYGDGSNLTGIQLPINYQENTSSNSLALGEGTVLGGGNNVIIGDGSSVNLSSGYENTIIGANTNFTGLTKGFVGIGRNASGASQQDSVLIGAASTGGSGASRYVGIGQGARLGNRTVAIGWRAGNVGSTYSVFLGHEAGYNETTPNRLYIANSNTSTPLIYGEFDNNKILINGELSASSHISASTYYGDGSNLTGISTTPFPYIGSAVITGSLTVSGSVVDFTSASAVNLNIDSLPLINPIVEYLDVTASIASGTTLSLPNNLSYISSSTYEYLEIFMNGLRMRYDRDFVPISNTTIQTQIAFPSGSELTFKSLRR